MNTKIRNAALAAGFLAGIGLTGTAAFAGDSTSTTVDPNTGASVTVQHHDAILPRNDSTNVTVTPGVNTGADVNGSVDAPDNGTVVEHHEETTVEHD
jgi:hypothetical protein